MQWCERGAPRDPPGHPVDPSCNDDAGDFLHANPGSPIYDPEDIPSQTLGGADAFAVREPSGIIQNESCEPTTSLVEFCIVKDFNLEVVGTPIRQTSNSARPIATDDLSPSLSPLFFHAHPMHFPLSFLQPFPFPLSFLKPAPCHFPHLF